MNLDAVLDRQIANISQAVYGAWLYAFSRCYYLL